MPKVRNNKRYLSPNQGKIMVQKKITRRKGNYILEETIGEGAFAKVKLGTHIHTGEKVAIKILNKEKLFEEALEDNLANGIEGCDIQKIRKEINILKRLRHKNVIQLYEIMESKTNLYIVMEYCEGKELFDYIVRHKYLSEREACRFFQQIIDGVEYLHLSNITHRDLKPENLLLDNKKRIRISDFGLSNMGEKIDSLLETPCGTPSYAPPEMLRGEKYNGVFSDIWSCGIILYTMLVGNLPCAESKEDLIYENIMTHNYYFPDNISDEAVDLIENMLKIDPSERYDFEQIKSHPWFNLVEPKLKPGIVYGVHKIPIDESILKKVEKYGYDKDKCKKSIENNNYDSYSSIYYLTLKQFTRENKSSISDLFSDEYLNYLKDYKNWLKPEEINNPLFMNYEVEMPFEIEQEKAKNYISNALQAYNDKNRKKNKNKNIEAIPEEESKNCNDMDVNLNYPLSTKNNNNSVNKRVFNNEIEKYKKEEEEKLNKSMEERSKEQKNKSTKNKNNNNYKTEKKLNLNSPNLSNINSSIVANMNKNKGFNKKQVGGGGGEINSSAKKIQNTSLYSNIYSNIKTPFKKQKIRKNASYGEMPFNELNNINIKDIIKKRVKNKKRSVDDCKQGIYSVKMKEKNNLVDLSNSKDKIIKKNNKVNEDDNKSTKNNNKDNYSTEMCLSNNDNLNKNKKKQNNKNTFNKSKNKTNKPNNKKSNNNINNKEVNKNNKNDINKDNKDIITNDKDINLELKNDINLLDINIKFDNNDIEKKDNDNNNKENKMFKESLSKFSMSKIEIETDEPKINLPKVENAENNKVNQEKDNMSNLDKTVISESLSSLSKTLLSPKAFSFLSNGNNINFNTNSSSYAKRVEYSNNKAKKKYIRPRFKKKIEEEKESNVELYTESINPVIKMNLIQKLENDEEKLNSEINFLNNITSDTTVESINSNNVSTHHKGGNDVCANGNLNMIHLMAKKMLKNSVFGKYLINNKKHKKSFKEEDLESKFYTLQKYKNIIGMIEHLKHKIFKKKYTDFNYETFDEYLNDEDDKLFNQSLLKTMGINRFIRNAKECLYRNKKINKRSQSRAYGLNSFKFNNVFQTQQKPTRFATTKKINYYDDNNNIFNKRNFGYYRPRNLNLSYLSSTNNSKDKIKNRRQKLNYYTTYNTKNNESMGSINENYNLIPINNKNKKYFSSGQNTVYHPEKCSSVPKKVKININIKKYNKNSNKNHGLNMNLLNRIRERINNDGRINKYKDKDKNGSKDKNNYHSVNKNKSLDYDYDYSKNKNRVNSSVSMNNIYESEESFSSGFNSSVEKDRTNINIKYNNKNNSLNYDSSNIIDEAKEEENNSIYKKNKNITTPELGAKYNNIFTKNDTSKYDNDNDHDVDHFINDAGPILVNLNNSTNEDESYSKKNKKDNLTNRDKIRITFNDVNAKKKLLKNSNEKNLYNSIFSPKSAISKKNNNNITFMPKNALFSHGVGVGLKKKDNIAIKDNEKLNKEIWKKNKNNKSVLDINKMDIGSEKNKNTKISYLSNSELEFSGDETGVAKDLGSNKLNKTTVNFYKKNMSKDGFVKDSIPIDLSCLLNLSWNEIKCRTKTYFKKIGYFYSEKENVIKATLGGTIIEMTLLKIDNHFNSIYFNTRVKTNDFRKEREIMRKLIIYLNKKE